VVVLAHFVCIYCPVKIVLLVLIYCALKRASNVGLFVSFVSNVGGLLPVALDASDVCEIYVCLGICCIVM